MDCQAFCLETGLALPTEDEWEFASRGIPGPPFRSNPAPSRGAPLRGFDLPAEELVSTKSSPNQFGLHDMDGGVAEWCERVVDLELSLGVAPKGQPGEMRFPAVRGGTARWPSPRDRDLTDPAREHPGVGFRVVLRLRD